MTEDTGTKLAPMLQKLNRRPPNALKHGGFSNLTVLPGEDKTKFVKLLEELTLEFKPSGAFEEDQVFTLAKLMWRRRNLGIYQRAEAARAEWGPYLVEDPHPQLVVDLALKSRLLAIAEQFTAKFSNEEALENEAKFMPAVREVALATKNLLAAVDADTSTKTDSSKGLGDFVSKNIDDFTFDFRLALQGDEITPEKLIRELEVDARLDAMIDRVLKRLMQLKAMKPMVGLGDAAHLG
jgi:hypothetical protein